MKKRNDQLTICLDYHGTGTKTCQKIEVHCASREEDKTYIADNVQVTTVIQPRNWQCSGYYLIAASHEIEMGVFCKDDTNSWIVLSSHMQTWKADTNSWIEC